MTQQSLAVDDRAPNWIADLVVGGTAALLAITVAQAALPNEAARLPKLQLTSKAAAAPQAAGAVKPTAPPAAPTGLTFAEPVPGYPIISPFGLRKLPWEEYGRLHQGVDIAAPAGLPVRAIADGVVTRVGRDGAYGRFVEVRHADGLASFYAHLGGFVQASQVGQAVRRSDPIGLVGSTGSSTGAHLHIEVRRDGRLLNPSYFIGKHYQDPDEVPYRQASYVPRRVRVAYVSFIPKSKREKMEAREEEKQLAALAAEEARKARAAAQAEARLAALTRLAVVRPEPIERLAAMPAAAAKPAETGAAIDALLESKPAAKPAAPPAPAPAATEAPVATAPAGALSVGVDANGRVRGTIEGAN